jgi:hypothetical protein
MAGMFNYGASTSSYLTSFSSFLSSLDSHQSAFLIPQASQGGFMSSFGSYHDPSMVFDTFVSNDRIIGIMPFLWDNPDTTGVKDIAILRDSYENFGGQIKYGKPISLDVSCSEVFLGTYSCHAITEGGWSPLSYQWVGCSGSGDEALCNTGCTQDPLGGQWILA